MVERQKLKKPKKKHSYSTKSVDIHACKPNNAYNKISTCIRSQYVNVRFYFTPGIPTISLLWCWAQCTVWASLLCPAGMSCSCRVVWPPGWPALVPAAVPVARSVVGSLSVAFWMDSVVVWFLWFLLLFLLFCVFFMFMLEVSSL